jgi:hypothetical protein
MDKILHSDCNDAGSIPAGLTKMTYIITFFAVFFTDIVNTYYIKAIAEDKPLVASTLAAIVMLIYSIALISFVNDNLMLIPALLGAFTGTYVAMIIKRKRG